LQVHCGIGTALASLPPRQNNSRRMPPSQSEIKGNTNMGNRLFWAMLWVIGIPLPILLILYMIFGGS
jgi:hypothetical protein